jgi:hypothetical protein
MQKVEGSSPFIRLTETARKQAVFVFPGSGENATLSQVFVTERPWRVDLSGQGSSVV